VSSFCAKPQYTLEKLVRLNPNCCQETAEEIADSLSTNMDSNHHDSDAETTYVPGRWYLSSVIPGIMTVTSWFRGQEIAHEKIKLQNIHCI
jgi:hypothetical protein